MRKSKSLQMNLLKRLLKKHLDKSIIDIFIIGSSLKNKLSPNDVDVIVLFKDKNLSIIEDKFYSIRKSLEIDNLHIESIFSESMFSESVFGTILHEGFSVRNNKSVSSLLGMKSFVLFSYSLRKLSRIEKVKFSQALYGRKKNGLLYDMKGISIGAGSFKVPVENEEIFKEFFEKWKIKYVREQILAFNKK